MLGIKKNYMQSPVIPADISQHAPGKFSLSGSWTACALDVADKKLKDIEISAAHPIVVDAAQLAQIDSVGVWILQRKFNPLRDQGASISWLHWPSHYQKLMDTVEAQVNVPLLTTQPQSWLEQIGRRGEAVWQDLFSLLSFMGENALALMRLTPFPMRWRWRAVLHNIQIAGFDALPIIGLTSFLLGVVVAYQGADQLRHYGANIFVVDLVGYSMLREFSPLITAIIIAGRSGSAYAAQIGTMMVTEEIDGMRTIGIEPIELLVLPKIIALALALPLLTMFSDLMGVLGGMIMARSQLDINFHEFLVRLGGEMHLSTLLIGIGKAFIFALVIAIIGCFQGFRTKGNADSVGRQTTRSVVQAIFIVIVLDAVFSVIFSLLDV